MADIILGVIIALLLGFAIYRIKKNKSKGCCKGCSGCAYAKNCKQQNKSKRLSKDKD